MSPIHAYLTFDGNAAEAMRFYEKTLGGTMQMMMTIGEAPDTEQMPADVKKRIMHASLAYGDGMLMASDTMPGQTYEGMKGFGVALTLETVAEARRVFDAFAEGGTVSMPFEKTFWVEGFGMVTDRFGTSWLINGGKPLV
ncbi:3-demethylubiquinone-9 3-methyltransferase [Variovorax sp. Root318D1]|uniref:VOC family protein n=1 Tax=Variovorax sp. Root318D1 TaxID=1736513 RepID=UPI0006FAF960|nr:VOC family protein [Variovorax sp. Root318D1]KQU85024.1 3-demethylubiquinone-9 3-methyltransferase [Variovorax sp. Root318D1]